MPDACMTLPVGSYEQTRSTYLGAKAYGTKNRRWVYVQFLDAVTYVLGHVTAPASATDFKVSNDVAGGSSINLRFAGAITNVDANGNAVTAVPAQNDFGWLMTAGFHSAIKTNGDDDIAAGDTLIMVATDGVCDSIAAATTTGTLLEIGEAMAADVDAANTVAGWIFSKIGW